MKKVYRLGTVREFVGKELQDVSVYVFVTYEKERLSISGVVGPEYNGNCSGACGQINMSLKAEEVNTKDTGWDHAKIKQLLDIWDEWHLNDMHPECAHQRAQGWGKSKITVATFRLRPEITEQQRLFEKNAIAQAKGDPKAGTITDEDRRVAGLPWEVKGAVDLKVGPEYELHSKEERWSGQTFQKEHPEGVLSKSCPVCAYKYGEAWLFVPVPEEVIATLESFPDADKPLPDGWRKW